MLSQDTVREVTRRIAEAARPELIVLFGSQARGTAGESSDLDLLVIQRTTLTRPKRSAPLYSKLRDFPFSKDIVVFTPEEVEEYRNLPMSFVMTALREGKVLYEK